MFEDKKHMNVKVIDFGCSLLAKGKNLVMGGTEYYMPPECLNGICNAKADAWAIGIIMYKLLSGNYPFLGMTSTEFYTHVQNGGLIMDGRNTLDIYKYIYIYI